MSDSHVVHNRERARPVRSHVWVVEEKVDGEWQRLRLHRGRNGPKVARGQRVRRLKGKELRQEQRREA